MSPLALTSVDLVRAQSVLGRELELWREAVLERSRHANGRGEPFDFQHDGPVLSGGLIWVGPRHREELLLALCDLERAATGMAFVRAVVAIQPIRQALAALGLWEAQQRDQSTSR